MIIDKKFSIITYAGSLPLNLMEKDSNISSNPQKSNDWDKLIQSVDVIYGTQKSDGTIPVFWTKRLSVNDQFGNTAYKYYPSPESTLKTLDSKSAYYIILKDSSATPIKVPSNGTLVLGYSDNQDLPYVYPSLSNTILDKTSSEYNFQPKIVNLRPYETYSYTWRALAGNWPVAFNAITGVIKPASTTGIINTSLTFCPSSTPCSSRILTLAPSNICSIDRTKDPFITLQLSVKDSAGSESLSDQFTVQCDDCLTRPRVNISGVTSSIVTDNDDSDATPSYSFGISFDDLSSDVTYRYSIETLRADWPIVYSLPTTGIFTYDPQNKNSIDGKFYFCPNTGLCIPNQSTIPEYQIPNYPKFLTGEIEYNVHIRASLSLVPPSICSSTNTYYSDISRIVYKKS